MFDSQTFHMPTKLNGLLSSNAAALLVRHAECGPATTRSPRTRPSTAAIGRPRQNARRLRGPWSRIGEPLLLPLGLPIASRVSTRPAAPASPSPTTRSGGTTTLSTANVGTQGYYIGRHLRGPLRLRADDHPARQFDDAARPAPTASSGSPISIARTCRTATARSRSCRRRMFVPNAFVSQEDMVWQDPNSNNYTINGQPGGTSVTGPSPVLPDLSPPTAPPAAGPPRSTGAIPGCSPASSTAPATSSCFDGNIVIFENRPFGIQGRPPARSRRRGTSPRRTIRSNGETVVEAVFGYSTTVITPGGPQAQRAAGYGSAADRTVLLRWSSRHARPGRPARRLDRRRDLRAPAAGRAQPLPELAPGQYPNLPIGGLQNWANKLEWDNLPAQRCYWYQVQKVGTPAPDVPRSTRPIARWSSSSTRTWSRGRS